MISKIIIFVIFHIFLIFSLESKPSKAQTWVRVGYFKHKQDFSISEIDSSLFTHLICGFADLDSTTYQLSLPYDDKNYFSIFTKTVKQKNPSVTTLLSIGGPDFYSMVSNSSYRKSFIDSSIKIARLYSFQGLDFFAIALEARNSSQQQQLILTAAVKYSPNNYSVSYPIESIHQYLNWVHVLPIDLSTLTPYESTDFTAATNPLYNPARFPANKLVMSLTYYGFACMLVNSNKNGIGAPANCITSSPDFKTYKEIKERCGAKVSYNETYVVNYCTFGRNWISFDDVDAVRTKISYAKKRGLLGYSVLQVSYDDNCILSQAAG
ncbi:hypothetical protein ACOSQ2_012746 [Xanthoceras sorbifolium]